MMQGQIVKIDLDYGASVVAKGLSPEAYARLAEILSEDPLKQDSCCLYGTKLVYLEELPELTEFGIAYRIVKFKNNVALNAFVQSKVQDAADVQHVHVHIPNIGLLSIRKVMALENACTDDIQRHLDSGWMILAVCHPNAQRRPNYILGRVDEEG